MRTPLRTALFLACALSAWAAFAAQTAPPGPQNIEARRMSRLIAHLKRLHRPEDWRMVRKLFSADRSVQFEALSNCPLPKNEWPWYLSSRHLEEYAFTADFIPVNMDADPESETLLVIRSDPGEVNYITFCLIDDEKRGRTPLASYSDISRGGPVTFQLADLSGDGASELVIGTSDGAASGEADTIRIIKAIPGPPRRFELVWFARLREEFVWPTVRNGAPDKRTTARRERLRAQMRLRFNGPGKPVTLVLKGERKEEKTVSFFNGIRDVSATSVQTFPFREVWRWEKKWSQFVRASSPAR